MTIVSWLGGLVLHRRARLLATAAGIAIAVSLIAAIGSFLSGSTAAMTDRALARVPLDWQVQGRTGTNPAKLQATVASFPGVRSALPVAYAHTSGYSAKAGGAARTASAGLALGIPANYRQTYPGEIRQFIGARNGVLVAQQMAANLGVTVGDTITIDRAPLAPVQVKVDGIVDFAVPQQLLGPVGATGAAASVPPPDNVVVMPATRWHQLFDALGRARPGLVSHQIHTELVHTVLPRDPTGAFAKADGLAKNLETRLAGSGTVGNNLAAALDHARGDSLYARVAFLFLGLPGALLAALLTLIVANAGADNRRREQALLRARGATIASLTRLAAAEAILVGLLGGAAGLLAALVIGRISFGSSSFGAGGGTAALWGAAAVVAGLGIAAAGIALPAWRDARRLTVNNARGAFARARSSWWARGGLDIIAIVASIVLFRAIGSGGYQIVLAVEGTTQVSVDYWAFAAPLLAWIGIGLLAYRLADLVLRRGRGLVAYVARPVAGGLAGTVAASMSRQRAPIARAVALVALATCFAASTAAFNTTYRQQAEADARLSNGADVVATAAPGATLTPSVVSGLGHLHGVASAEPLQHRYAYIGNDLQDLYGVNAPTVVHGGRLQDAWFAGGSAAQLFAKLGRTPDGILLSEEVVHDYQLKAGDHVKLRLLNQSTHATRMVPFTYIGITKEFPTAPKDAYTIANRSYVAKATGDSSTGTVLIQTSGASPSAVGALVAQRVGRSGTVTTIEGSRTAIASSLTSVELAGLTRVELAYALVLLAAATGLLLWLSLAERRRTYAIAHALGARPRQLAGFVWPETAFVTITGAALGAAGAAWLTWMLVKLLTGVFDPPPTQPAVPWIYLVTLTAVAAAAVVTAGLATLRALRNPAIETLRDL
jgi:putative ABC transport system permease protein